MRRLVVLIVVAATLWGGYWFIAARALDNGLRAGIAAQQQAGWRIGHSALRVRGFPSRLDTTIEEITVGDPGGTVIWRAPFVQMLMLSYRPHHVIAVWPHDQTLITPLGAFAIASTDMRASVTFQARTDLALDHVTTVIDGLSVLSDRGWQIDAENARFATRLVPMQPDTHELGLEITGATLPAALLAQMGLSPTAPRQMEKLGLTAELGFDRPLNRFVLGAAAPRITRRVLTGAHITWGGLVANGTGAVSVDAQGRPSGDMTLHLTGWRQGLETGLIPAQWRQVLTLLGGADGTLELPLSFREGQIFSGAVPVGPAPMLRLP
ncbi:DUF2125 domain-containing protein [Actibacterium sp. D379-3]